MRRRASAGHGPNKTEAQVMALWDAGSSFEQIAARMGISRDLAGRIVSYLDVNGPEDRNREAADRRACASYAAAIAATGKAFA